MSRRLPILVVLLGLALSAPGATAQPIRVGYGDTTLTSEDPTTREFWFERAVRAGGSLVRVNVSWAAVAPKGRPAGFVPSDPASPGYDWTAFDDAVRSASAQGLAMMMTVTSAPAWAEGPARPQGARPGTWMPSPSQFEQFARALGRRYDGSYPDPLHPGRALPAVPYFEVWNEPNQDYFLAPQWEDGKWVGPGLYRNLLNHFYAGLKSADPSAQVIAGGMSPFGDPPGGSRTPPVEFLRGVLCLKGGRLRPVACPHPARMDILSDHPITVSKPTEPAASPLDVSTPDLGRLTRILRKAERLHRVLPRGHRPLWATEYWFDTNPPDPNGIPLSLQARWYQQALHEVWLGGASAFFIQPLADHLPIPNYSLTQQAGVYFVEGGPKPSRRAMSFPLVASRDGRSRVAVWGVAPRRGTVRVQASGRAGWKTLARIPTRGRPWPFHRVLKAAGPVKLRAVMGSASSLVWAQP